MVVPPDLDRIHLGPLAPTPLLWNPSYHSPLLSAAYQPSYTQRMHLHYAGD